MTEPTKPPAWRRFFNYLATIRLTSGAKVTPVAPGATNDGLNRRYGGGSDIDRPNHERYDDITSSLDAWRKNPMAKRIINLVTAYVVGDGIRIASKYEPLQKFIDKFWLYRRNHLILRQSDWCDALSISGEIFVVLFTNPADGISEVRAIPATRIDEITFDKNDYELELAYHEVGDLENADGTWWKSFDNPTAAIKDPIMLHFAVNRPVGALRGEGDLNAILIWLKRYSRWLEDRIRMNAGMRAFLWIVHAPKNLVKELTERYGKTAPEPGSIIIAEPDEKWEAVTPSLHAQDAASDGLAQRWNIVAGGPGIGLTDLGEPTDANQSTATVMVDIRRRFLKRRQSYFAWMLADLTLKAYERSRQHQNANRKACTHLDLILDTPDISGEDNQNLAAAVRDLSLALGNMQTLLGDSTELREVSLRLFAKFAEEDIPRSLAEPIIAKGEKERAERLAREIAAQEQKARQPTK